ncbi:MAG: hypothetical protein HZA35_00495 [Parcubacteria group bacterium]|nr:hypothetical protein [Parcubacteria group bacterium]
MYKKIGCTVLIVFVLFVSQPGTTNALAGILGALKEIPVDAAKVNDVAKGLDICSTDSLRNIVSAEGVSDAALQAAGFAVKEKKGDLFTTIFNAPFDLIRDAFNKKELGKDTKDILVSCQEISVSLAEVSTNIGLYTVALAETQVWSPICDFWGTDPACAKYQAANAEAEGLLAKVTASLDQISIKIHTLQDLVKQQEITTNTRKAAEEDKKQRQLIQFDGILKKITERLKLALTETIKSKMLGLLQNNGAPRWITNWGTRYANTYFNAYQNTYQQVYLQEERGLEQARQRVKNFPSVRVYGIPSTKPDEPVAILAQLLKNNYNILASIEALGPLRARKAGTDAGENAEKAVARLDAAENGMVGDGDCVFTGNNSTPGDSGSGTFTGSTSGKTSPNIIDTNSITKPTGARGTAAFLYNPSQQFASNARLLEPYVLSKTAIIGNTGTGSTDGASDGSHATAIESAANVQETVQNTTQLDPNDEFMTDADVCNGAKTQDACIGLSTYGCGWEPKTRGATHDKVENELMGIDIKQMLNNTIEEWMNSFLDNSIINKLTGKKGGKTANIGDILKKNALGQLSQYGNSLDSNNPAKDFIEQFVSQNGSLDGMFGGSSNGGGSSGGGYSGGSGGGLAGMTIGDNTGGSAQGIDCSVLPKSAQADCETAAGLFNTGQDIQQEYNSDAINNLDLPNRIQIANEQLRVIDQKLQQAKTIYEDIARCPSDNRQIASDALPNIATRIVDNDDNKATLNDEQAWIDNAKDSQSKPQQLEPSMQLESQFLTSVDTEIKAVEQSIPERSRFVNALLAQVVSIKSHLEINAVENTGAIKATTKPPANIGATGQGCFNPLHTVDASGDIFIQSLAQKAYTLGDLFTAWPETLNNTQVLSYKVDPFHDITMFVNNASSTEFQNLVLQNNQTIAINYTTKPADTCFENRHLDRSICDNTLCVNNRLPDGITYCDNQTNRPCVSGQLNRLSCTIQQNQSCTPQNNQLWCQASYGIFR